MKGDIWIESRMGVGSSFFFTAEFGRMADSADEAASLPSDVKTIKTKGEEGENGIPLESAAEPGDQKEFSDFRILIVEDNAISRKVVSEILDVVGFTVDTVENGVKAVEVVKQKRYDAVLMDVQMPGMDGYEVCTRLKSNPETRDIPILFITALDESGHKTKGFEAGAVDYITKPFDIAEVRARVKTHLALKTAQEALKSQNYLLEEKVLERTRVLEQTQIEIVNRLGKAAEYRDEETGQHIQRMSKYCRVLGKAAGLSEKESGLLALASTMHDVGKIGISDTILFKPGKLTAEQWETMKTHAAIGAGLLSGSDTKLLQEAETIARTHHEKWDGSGYPQGLREREIPLYGRIVCIGDVFDALISERPYKKAWPVDQALDGIRAGKGSHFDPTLADFFLDQEPDHRKIVGDFRQQGIRNVAAYPRTFRNPSRLSALGNVCLFPEHADSRGKDMVIDRSM